MPMSHFSHGFANGVSILGMPVLNSYAGNVSWVSSTAGSNGNDGTRGRAYATLAKAITAATADKGDVIMLAPGHAETITGAGGLALNKAGLTIVGMGSGTQRPRFLMDGGTSVSADVTAANVSIANIVFASGHLLVTAGFNVTAVGFWADRLEFSDNTTAENWATPFKATGATGTANGLKITNCRWVPRSDAVNALEFVEITDDIADMVIEDNFIVHEGTASPLVLQAGSKIMTKASIMRNFISHKMTAGDLFIDNGGAANSGIIAHNRIGNADVTTSQEGGAATGMRFFDNLYTSTAVDSGALVPAAETPLS